MDTVEKIPLLVKEKTFDRVKDKALDVVQTRKAKRRYKDEEAITEGWLFRETSVQGLVNRRYGALYSTAFVTARKEDASVPPTKIWNLEDGCLVTPMLKGEFMIRHKGVSTLWSVARGHYTKSIMYSFSVKFPAGNAHYRDPLRLCFDNEVAARDWQADLTRIIKALSLGLRRRSTGNALHRMDQAQQEQQQEQNLLSADEQQGASATLDSQASSLDQAGLTSSLHDSVQSCIQDSWDSLRPEGHTHPGPKRSSVQHVNGVAVYQEEGSPDGKQGAFMVSAVVSAGPKEVFSALAAVGKATPLSFDWQLIDRLDSKTRIIRHLLIPSGLARLLCATREAVLQQSWRVDEDGTITVLGQSVEHAQAATEEHSWAWFAPIRAQVESAGFTLAPLQQCFQQSHLPVDSCLVTFVLKMDLGGWLSETSWLNTLLQPLVRQMTRAFLEPLLMSLIALRDQVEQSRYVVQPFMMATLPTGQPVKPAGLPPLKAGASRQLKSVMSYRHSVPEEPTGKTSTAATELPSDEQHKQEPIDEEAEFSDVLEIMAEHSTLDQKYWSCPGAAGMHVRGPNYLQDHKKVPGEEPIFNLASADLVQIGRRPFHVAPNLPCIKNSKAPFNFVLNLMIPGPQQLALAVTWAADQAPSYNHSREPHLNRETSITTDHGDSDSEAGGAPFDILLARFLSGDDEEADTRRNSIFKLIPSVVKGSWVIKQSVGHTPVLLGRKLKTQYHRGPNYFEVDVDVSSSRAANSVVGMVSGATTSLIIDMAIVLEGHSHEELPESLLGTVRFSHLDMKAIKVLSENGESSSASPVTDSERKAQ